MWYLLIAFRSLFWFFHGQISYPVCLRTWPRMLYRLHGRVRWRHALSFYSMILSHTMRVFFPEYFTRGGTVMSHHCAPTESILQRPWGRRRDSFKFVSAFRYASCDGRSGYSRIEILSPVPREKTPRIPKVSLWTLSVGFWSFVGKSVQKPATRTITHT